MGHTLCGCRHPLSPVHLTSYIYGPVWYHDCFDSKRHKQNKPAKRVTTASIASAAFAFDSPHNDDWKHGLSPAIWKSHLLPCLPLAPVRSAPSSLSRALHPRRRLPSPPPAPLPAAASLQLSAPIRPGRRPLARSANGEPDPLPTAAPSLRPGRDHPNLPAAGSSRPDLASRWRPPDRRLPGSLCLRRPSQMLSLDSTYRGLYHNHAQLVSEIQVSGTKQCL